MNSLPPLPESVIEAGLAYGEMVFGINLNRETLVFLYDRTRARRAHLKCTFAKARAWALDGRLPQRTHRDQALYRAYSGALGKMGNLMRMIANRPAKHPQKRTPTERIKDYVTLDIDERQYRFIL